MTVGGTMTKSHSQVITFIISSQGDQEKSPCLPQSEGHAATSHPTRNLLLLLLLCSQPASSLTTQMCHACHMWRPEVRGPGCAPTRPRLMFFGNKELVPKPRNCNCALITFDFEKAFDKVDRKLIWLRLEERGINLCGY